MADLLPINESELRVGIDLPVARMQHHAGRRPDGDAIGFRDGVRQGDHLQIERTELEAAVERDFVQLDLIQQTVFAQPVSDQPGGERRCPDRTFQPPPEMRHGAHMVFVGMGQDHADQIVPTLLDEARVGHDEINARRCQIAEGHAAIDDDPGLLSLRPIAVEIEIHADFIGSAERQEIEAIGHVLLPPLSFQTSRRPRMVRSAS